MTPTPALPKGGGLICFITDVIKWIMSMSKLKLKIFSKGNQTPSPREGWGGAFLIRKEFLQIRRNAFLPKIFVVLPIIMLLIVPYAANQEVKDLKFCVVDNDRSTLSRELVAQVDASKYFMLESVQGDYRSALEQVEMGRADVILDIPHGFSSDVVREGTASVNVNVNAVNGVKGALGQAYILSIISDFTLAQREERGIGVGQGAAGGVDVRPRYLFNAALDYKVYMVPGIIAMLLTLLIGFLPAINIVGEKEKGTIEQINVTPVSRMDFILSKLIPYWIIGLFMLLWSMLWAYILYGMRPEGSVWLVLLSSLLFFLIVSSLGLIVSNCSATMRQAALLMLFFLIIFVLMSGLLTPIASMPDWAQAITYANPLRYYIEALRALYLKGSTLADLQPQLLSMAAYAVVSWAGAILSYKKTN